MISNFMVDAFWVLHPEPMGFYWLHFLRKSKLYAILAVGSPPNTCTTESSSNTPRDGRVTRCRANDRKAWEGTLNVSATK